MKRTSLGRFSKYYAWLGSRTWTTVFSVTFMCTTYKKKSNHHKKKNKEEEEEEEDEGGGGGGEMNNHSKTILFDSTELHTILLFHSCSLLFN